MICSDYTQDVLYTYYDKRISKFLATNQKEAAQGEAFSWLQEYVKPLCISVPWNWKIAKKQIVAYFFGKTSSVQLHFNENIDQGVHFILSHPNQNVRCSYHKFDTACHSESRRINTDSLDWLIEMKNKMSPNDIIDIFTETSTQTTTCFRRVSLQYNESVAYEMGFGQAMYVFETERGKHNVAGMDYTNGIWKLKMTTDPILISHLEHLVDMHEQRLSMKTRCMCYYLGIPQISIEGYFDTAYPLEKPVIVDIDLPFDRAFF